VSEVNQPAWRKRASGPGIWVCYGECELDGRLTAVRLTQDDLDRGAPFHVKQVYGPIPEPAIKGDA